MDNVTEEYPHGNPRKIARLQKPVYVSNSTKRENLMDCIKQICITRGYKTPETLHTLKDNKEAIRETFNLLMLATEISDNEDVLKVNNQCLKTVSEKRTQRKLQTPKFNAQSVTEVEYFKCKRLRIDVKKISRNYLREIQRLRLLKLRDSTDATEPIDGVEVTMDPDSGDSLSDQPTTSNNTQLNNCSMASTRSSTVSVYEDSMLQDIRLPEYTDYNSDTMYCLNDSEGEAEFITEEIEDMEEDYSYNSDSDDEMEDEFDSHNNDNAAENEVSEAQYIPNNSNSTNGNVSTEHYTSNNNNTGANEKVAGLNSNNEHGQLQQQYFHYVGTNEHALESFVRLMLYTNALMEIKKKFALK